MLFNGASVEILFPELQLFVRILINVGNGDRVKAVQVITDFNI